MSAELLIVAVRARRFFMELWPQLDALRLGVLVGLTVSYQYEPEVFD